METLIDIMVESSKHEAINYTAKDFKSPLEVRWCAGCGGYSILAQTQKIMAGLGVPRENIAFVSGIGCSSRFPYYMQVYGFHSIHGRALAIASGLKISRPELSVWVATGDGDCMSIGGNHFIHAMRRNIDLNILMFNNEIYSLTKGQYSPTSKPGQVTKTSPHGVLDYPFNPVALALGSSGTFVARSFDGDPKHMQAIMERAAAHKGTSFMEVYTNCVVYNDNAFDFTSKENRKEKTVQLDHGKPLVFGNENDKGIRLDGFKPMVVNLANGSYSANDLLIHDEKDSTLAFILANMTWDETLPRPIGVFQAIDRPTYEDKIGEQIHEQIVKKGEGAIFDLLKGDDFWEIKA